MINLERDKWGDTANPSCRARPFRQWSKTIVPFPLLCPTGELLQFGTNLTESVHSSVFSEHNKLTKSSSTDFSSLWPVPLAFGKRHDTSLPLGAVLCTVSWQQQPSIYHCISNNTPHTLPKTKTFPDIAKYTLVGKPAPTPVVNCGARLGVKTKWDQVLGLTAAHAQHCWHPGHTTICTVLYNTEQHTTALYPPDRRSKHCHFGTTQYSSTCHNAPREEMCPLQLNRQWKRLDSQCHHCCN
jgi:hypothetical protein